MEDSCHLRGVVDGASSCLVLPDPVSLLPQLPRQLGLHSLAECVGHRVEVPVQLCEQTHPVSPHESRRMIPPEDSNLRSAIVGQDVPQSPRRFLWAAHPESFRTRHQSVPFSGTRPRFAALILLLAQRPPLQRAGCAAGRWLPPGHHTRQASVMTAKLCSGSGGCA